MTGVFLTIFALFWSGMVLMFDGFMGHGLYKQYEAQHFLTTTGTITHSELTSSRGSKGGTSYGVKLEYKYNVNGQVFTGDKIRFGIGSSSYASASSVVNAHPMGSEVQVFYNPADSQESLLEPGVKGSDMMGFIFMTPFNMVMLGFWIAIGGWLRERWFKPAAGGVKIISDGATTRVRLPRFPALAWGIIATGGLGFISIFIVGFSTNMDPSMAVAVAVLAGIYAAGFGVFIWQRQKINSGIDDLILTESSQTVELPLTFDRKERMAVNIADIRSLSVEKIEHRSNKGGISYTYAPTLCLGGASSSVQKLADWSDEAKANAFADWLRQKLGSNMSAAPVAEVLAAEDEAKQSVVAATREKEVEEMYRDGKSRIKVSDGPEGREFYFPPARNPGTTVFLTLFALVFCGVAGVTFFVQAPILFRITFSLVGLVLLLVAFNLCFKSVCITVNSTNVRVKKRWLVFSRTRDFSTGDYTRFGTKMGMQSGSQIFTDIRLVRAGADADFVQDQKKFQDVQGVNQLVVERFRQAAGPSGVTVAGSIGNSAEAEWLVKEMNHALGEGQSHAGYSPSEIVSGPSKAIAALMAIFVAFVFAGGVGYEIWHHLNPTSTKLSSALPNPAETNSAATKPAPPPPILDVAFRSSDPHDDYETNGWPVGVDGHADWFVSKSSGKLSKLELKIELAEQPGGKLFVSIMEDQGGFPGQVLETLPTAKSARANSAGWLVLASRQQPALTAGTKYWLSAKSSGAWFWHYGGTNLVQTSMHSVGRRAWAAAGYTNVCAFSVVTERNASAP